MDGEVSAVGAMSACDADGPLQVMIAKLYPKSDCSSFDCLVGLCKLKYKLKYELNPADPKLESAWFQPFTL